tara:strand:+ start:233 stop:499 length:267 start_codon:yes stop_codon:yes gene_type:complete
MKKSIIGILRFLFWGYAMTGYLLLMSIVPLILLGIFFKPLQDFMILENVLALFSALMSNGVVGFIAIAFYVGQFFLSYYLYKWLGRFV